MKFDIRTLKKTRKQLFTFQRDNIFKFKLENNRNALDPFSKKKNQGYYIIPMYAYLLKNTNENVCLIDQIIGDLKNEQKL